MSLERLDRAASAAACDTLEQLGPALIGLGVWTLWAKGVGVVPLAAGMASNLAFNYACNEQVIGNSPSSSPARGCQELSAGTGAVFLVPPTGEKVLVVQLITGYRLDEAWPGEDSTRWFWSIQRGIGNEYYREAIPVTVPNGWTLEMELDINAVCGKNAPYVPPLPPITTPYNYTDTETGCSLTVNFQGFVQETEGGNVSPVYLISSPSDDSRANGGRIVGGCNFAPTIYYGGPGGPGGPNGPSGPNGPVTVPVPEDEEPDDENKDEPWWLEYVRGAVGGAAAALVAKALENALEKEQPEMLYQAVSVCEQDEDGEPTTETIEIPALKAPEAQIARLDAIVELMQAHKNFKQPICGQNNEKPILEGEWRTISFRSTETSPYGKSCLRKRFRYRSVSGLGLDALVDHWKDFTFESGAVIVSHKGHSWGTPQVWAASQSEGKRVIQHAAREAGFDADQVGEWGISSSASPRYGVPAQMIVDTRKGYWWISNRDGAANRPIVAYSPDP